jgi:hypothetical protein
MTTRSLVRSLAALAGLALFAPAAPADPLRVFTFEHIDLDLRLEGGSPVGGGRLEIGWHVEDPRAPDNGTEYDADDVLVRFTPGSIVPRPAGSQWNFLGTGAGQPVWVLPQVQNPTVVWPGIGTEEIPDDLFDGDEVFLELIAVRGPGTFSIWGTDLFGDPDVVFGGTGSVAGPLAVPADSHVHYNWGLSAAGGYEIDFRVFGFINGTRFESDVTTVFLEAQQVQDVPGPASVLVLGLAVVPLLARKRRPESV